MLAELAHPITDAPIFDQEILGGNVAEYQFGIGAAERGNQEVPPNEGMALDVAFALQASPTRFAA